MRVICIFQVHILKELYIKLSTNLGRYAIYRHSCLLSNTIT